MIAEYPVLYPGASEEIKNCGAMMLATQYAMNISALTVVFLVWPEVLAKGRDVTVT